jgi:hypothetical protein
MKKIRLFATGSMALILGALLVTAVGAPLMLGRAVRWRLIARDLLE